MFLSIFYSCFWKLSFKSWDNKNDKEDSEWEWRLHRQDKKALSNEEKKKTSKKNWLLLRNINKIESVFFIQKTVFLMKSFYSLKNLIILNSDSTIHVFNEIICFLNFQTAQPDDFLWADDHKVSIQEYDEVDVKIQIKTDKYLMRFHEVTFYKNFAVNLILLCQLHQLSYWWDNRSEFNHIYKIN